MNLGKLINVLTSILRMQVCHSDPIIFKDIVIDHRIKGTLGITG